MQFICNFSYAVATEDMDALTFGTPILLRHMTFSESRKMPIVEFDLAKWVWLWLWLWMALTESGSGWVAVRG
jgi:hypothetical protein